MKLMNWLIYYLHETEAHFGFRDPWQVDPILPELNYASSQNLQVKQTVLQFIFKT